MARKKKKILQLFKAVLIESKKTFSQWEKFYEDLDKSKSGNLSLYEKEKPGEGALSL